MLVDWFLVEPLLTEHDDGGGGSTSDNADSGGKEEKPDEKPKPDLITMTSEDLNARLDRARRSWERDLETKRNEEQGEFKTIVESEYKPLKDRVEKELEPELESWRKLARQEITALKKDVPEAILDLMPDGLAPYAQLDWLRKAKDRVAKLQGDGTESKDTKDDSNGNNPLDDPKHKKPEDRNKVLEKIRDQFVVSTRYAT